MGKRLVGILHDPKKMLEVIPIVGAVVVVLMGVEVRYGSLDG